MPRAKKEEAVHDCKAECAELHKQISELKKEIAALKKAPKSAGGADPRVDVLIEALTKNATWSWAKTINEKLK